MFCDDVCNDCVYCMVCEDDCVHCMMSVFTARSVACLCSHQQLGDAVYGSPYSVFTEFMAPGICNR